MFLFWRVLVASRLDLIRAERYREGVEALRALVRVAPQTDQAYISLADAARKMGDSAQELAALRDLSTYKPDYPMLHVLIARALINQERPDYSKVLHELSLAAIDAPTDPDVFLSEGKAYAALGRFDEAVSANVLLSYGLWNLVLIISSQSSIKSSAVHS